MKSKELLILVIGTFVFVSLWIVFNIIHNASTSTIPSSQTETINGISPSFDTQTITLLKLRRHVDPLFSNAISTQSATAPSPTPSAPPLIPSPAPSLPTTSPQQASQGGTIKQ